MPKYHPNSGAIIAVSLKTAAMDEPVLFPVKTYTYDQMSEDLPVRTGSSAPFEDILPGFRRLNFDMMGYVMMDFDPFVAQAKVKIGDYADIIAYTKNNVRAASANILVTEWKYYADEDNLVEYYLSGKGNWRFGTFKDV